MKHAVRNKLFQLEKTGPFKTERKRYERCDEIKRDTNLYKSCILLVKINSPPNLAGLWIFVVGVRDVVVFF
jgi:hypothetical protein